MTQVIYARVLVNLEFSDFKTLTFKNHSNDSPIFSLKNYIIEKIFSESQNPKMKIIPFFIHDIMTNSFRYSIPTKSVQYDGTFIFIFFSCRHFMMVSILRSNGHFSLDKESKIEQMLATV